MAACGFGASGLKIRTLNFGCLSPKVRTLQPLHSLRTRRNLVFDGLVLYHRSNKAVFASQSLDSDSIATAPTYVDNKSEDTKSDDAVSTLVPNTVEVESLLTTLCDTSIAEFELKLGGFHLYVMRDLGGQSETPQPQATAPVITHTVVEAPASNGSASSPSLALAKTIPNSDVLTVLDKAADEGLMILQSPRVGYFRRSRTIKGKRAPPSCKEKSIVKEGQVLCYIEQLGGELPVESDVSGEVVKILKEDGDPVGYGDALIAVLPSFPGIKM